MLSMKLQENWSANPWGCLHHDPVPSNRLSNITSVKSAMTSNSCSHTATPMILEGSYFSRRGEEGAVIKLISIQDDQRERERERERTRNDKRAVLVDERCETDGDYTVLRLSTPHCCN